MEKLLLSAIIFMFMLSTSYAQPGYKPLTPQQKNYQHYQQQRQQQNWDSMKRQQENYEIKRKIDSQRLNDYFGRDIKRRDKEDD